MSQTLPLYLSVGINRPFGFYDDLKNVGQNWQGFFRDIEINPDPHHKLPTLRPPREFYGVREGMPSAPAIAATAKVSGNVASKGKPAPKPSKAKSLYNAMLQAFGLAKKPVTNDEDEEEEGMMPYLPIMASRSGGGLITQKPD